MTLRQFVRRAAIAVAAGSLVVSAGCTFSSDSPSTALPVFDTTADNFEPCADATTTTPATTSAPTPSDPGSPIVRPITATFYIDGVVYTLTKATLTAERLVIERTFHFVDDRRSLMVARFVLPGLTQGIHSGTHDDREEYSLAPGQSIAGYDLDQVELVYGSLDFNGIAIHVPLKEYAPITVERANTVELSKSVEGAPSDNGGQYTVGFDGVHYYKLPDSCSGAQFRVTALVVQQRHSDVEVDLRSNLTCTMTRNGEASTQATQEVGISLTGSYRGPVRNALSLDVRDSPSGVYTVSCVGAGSNLEGTFAI